jgi:para-aminobenzoate synthetase component 1
LESARTGDSSGHLSIIASRPFETLTLAKLDPARKDPWRKLRSTLKKYSTGAHRSYPFTGGAMGYISYECKDLIEKCLRTSAPDKNVPPLFHFSFFDHALIVDHLNKETQLAVSDGRRMGASRIKELLKYYSPKLAAVKARSSSSDPRTVQKQVSISSDPIECSFDPTSFQVAVKKAKDHIKCGDVFQVNLAQRLRFPLKESAATIYARLRALNPSPFFGLYDTGRFQILSGSPERLLKLEDRLLETRPIAGTRARGKNEADDQKVAQDLILNPKERAEHVMLVDLERNDMGRVAEFGSVEVNELMALENYSHVKHIVSNVRAVLREGLDAVDALQAFFPGGTITGAPKIRSMEIIDELEPVRRGPYTGSLGYLSFSGNMDMNILIRSLVIQDGMASLHVGAGIVADSDPRKEYEETLYKAEAVLCAVFGAREVSRFFKRCGLKHR